MFLAPSRPPSLNTVLLEIVATNCLEKADKIQVLTDVLYTCIYMIGCYKLAGRHTADDCEA